MSDTAQAKQAFDWQAEEAQLSERCAQLVELARAAGADEAEAFGQRAGWACMASTTARSSPTRVCSQPVARASTTSR